MLKRFKKDCIHCPVVVYDIDAVFWEEKHPKMTKNNKKFLVFKVFMQSLSYFRWTSWIRMMRMLNMALIRCPVEFSEKIVAVFQIKMSRIDTEND